MTTATKTWPLETTEEYSPDLPIKIQRILYRLEQNEVMIVDYLHQDAGYCVLGLFADESGLGEWKRHENAPGNFYYTVDGEEPAVNSPCFLPTTVAEHYGLNSVSGLFNIKDLSESLYNRIEQLLGQSIFVGTTTLSLLILNDRMTKKNVPTATINEVLAQVIRSGIVFKDR